MDIINTIMLVVVCLFSPLLILWLTYKSSILNKVGSIILAYVLGCLLGLTGLIPDTEEVRSVQTLIASASIPFAIPLMLFSSDVKSWAKLAPSFLKSLLFGICGCILAIAVGFYFYGVKNPEVYSSVGGMLTGLYTGGTANLASLKVALGVDDDIYLQVHTYSIAVSAIYLIFVVVFGKRVLRFVLPDFKENKTVENNDIILENHENELFLGLFRKDNMKHLSFSILLTICVIVLGAGMASLFPKDMFQAIFILSISMLAIIASMFRKVRSTKRTFEAGTYFILIFSVAVSSQVSVDMFENIDPSFFMFTVVATLGGLLIHILFSSIFRVDTDTTLTTSISLICSPPFVPVMAGALHNKAVIGPAIAVGLFGYAVGTYLGFGVAKALLLFF